MYLISIICITEPHIFKQQIISTPDLQIVDFGYGFTGSTHDATAWEHTHMFQAHNELLSEGEFVWADSAYPVSSASFSLY
jgi:hypothetical protein